MSASYDDIINLPHPTSAKHPRMPAADRAAIFSPFQALVGHGAAIEKTAWLTDQKIELAEEEKALLDDKLRLLLGTGRAGAFNWFLRDERKDSGAYVTAVGIENRKKFDQLARQVVLTDRTAIPIEDILEIEIQAPPGQGL